MFCFFSGFPFVDPGRGYGTRFFLCVLETEIHDGGCFFVMGAKKGDGKHHEPFLVKPQPAHYPPDRPGTSVKFFEGSDALFVDGFVLYFQGQFVVVPILYHPYQVLRDGIKASLAPRGRLDNHDVLQRLVGMKTCCRRVLRILLKLPPVDEGGTLKLAL